MLVLTRKQQEKIRIGDDIVITVLRMKGKTVRLGIEAPDSVSVLRGELVFEISADDSTPPEDEDAPNDDSPAAVGTRPDNRRLVGAWSAEKSQPARREQAVRSGDAEFAVRLHRVTRDGAAAIVSQLVPSAGPLRGMLDRRAEIAPGAGKSGAGNVAGRAQ